MKCPKCNRPIEPDSLFCEHCGSKIEKPLAGADQPSRPENRFNPKWLILALLPLLVIGAIAIAGLFGPHRSADRDARFYVADTTATDIPAVTAPDDESSAAQAQAAGQPQTAPQAGSASQPVRQAAPQAAPVQSVKTTAATSRPGADPEEYEPARPQPTTTPSTPASPPNPAFEREKQSAGAIYCNGINPDHHDTEQYFSSNIGSMNRDHFVLSFAFLVGEPLSQPVMTLSDSHRVLALRLQPDGTIEIVTDNGAHVYPLRHRYALNTWYPIELSYCRGSLRVGVGSDYELFDIVMNSAQLGDNRLSTVDHGTGKAFKGLVRNIGVIRDND